MKALDMEGECNQLAFAIGAAHAVCGKTRRGRDLARMLWRLIPFVKALTRVGLRHSGELLLEWEKSLQEPMPFGEPPIGLPKEEN